MTNDEFFHGWYVKGAYNPSDPAIVAEQLTGDSELFLEGNIFEHHFTGYFNRRDIVTGKRYPLSSYTYTTDLACVYIAPGHPEFYRVLGSISEAEQAEQLLADMSRRLSSVVWAVAEDGGMLHKRECTQSGFRNSGWLVMQSQRRYSSNIRSAKRQSDAIDWIMRKFSKDELRRFSIKRMLMNCFLGNAGGIMTDIDGLLTAPDEHTAIVEFKRKDPDADGGYGLDRQSAFATYEFCRGTNRDYIFVVLNDPVTRSRDRSPLRLFSSQAADTVEWRCSRLARHEPIDFIGKQSKSADSSGKRRSAFTFPSGLMSVAGRGLRPRHLDLSAET